MFENVSHFGLQEGNWTVNANQPALVCLMNMSDSQQEEGITSEVLIEYFLTEGLLWFSTE